MSAPITCLPKRQDGLFHVLFCSDVAYISRLIEESIINLAREYPSPNVQEILVRYRPCPSDSLDILRAKFFILLNQDMQTRRELAKPRGKSALVSGVCDYKAARFYDDLSSLVIPQYAQNQKMPLCEFIDNLRDCYLCS